jgi:intracellular sulfur oxidation DsrE/DsrF family protein
MAVSEKKGVLFHVNDADAAKQRAALRNIENLLVEMPNMRVELVIQGDAVNMAASSQSRWPGEIQALQDKGVSTVVCLNSMKANNLTEGDLLPSMTIVPSAVGELVRRQQEGMAYVKP